MSSFLDKKTGIFDPSKRYGFKNITENPFTFTWGGNPITVKPGDEVELPEHYALLATKNLVDQIMQEEAHAEEQEMKVKKNDPYWRSPKGIAVGIPAARKPYEDKILRELKLNEESPQVQVMRAQIKEQLMADLTNGQQPPAPIESALGGIAQMGNPTAPKEFSEIPQK